jgi:hypothetical protein
VKIGSTGPQNQQENPINIYSDEGEEYEKSRTESKLPFLF